MIFNNNTTSLGSIDIPMAEGYDCSYGCALALVESARNDYAMFRAMLDADARELAIKNESTGYVAESQISALHEAAVSGIWTKIKQLIQKLVAKIKSIFHSFAAKINSLFMKDKELIKKYRTEVLSKSNINKLEVKWRKVKGESKFNQDIAEFQGYFGDLASIKAGNSSNKFSDKWADDIDNRWKNICDSENSAKYKEALEKAFWEDDSADTVAVEKIGGMKNIIDTLSGFKKRIDDLSSNTNKYNTAATKAVNALETLANKRKDDLYGSDEPKNGATETAVENANKAYDVAVVIQDATMTLLNTHMACLKADYAQHKAAFAKAIRVNEKKLSEQYTYLDAVAEAAEQEVEDVISGALKSDGDYLSSTSIASTNVMDSDVSDDAEKLVYDKKQFYSTDLTDVDTAGTIDTNINSKEESAFFGKLIY